MKVLGELQGAQLEQIAATSTTPASTGRVYIDVTAPTAAIPMIYDGTSWKQIQMAQSTAVVSQNSGTSCTVNWATGLNQQVILTANCVISFSNPVSGAEHRLIVQQAPYSAGVTQYIYNFNMTDQDCDQYGYQPRPGVINNGLSKNYKWLYSSAHRAAYATIPALTFAPSAAGIAAPKACDISRDGTTFSVPHSTTPFSSIYILGTDGGTRPVIGPIGVTTPPTLAASANAVAFSPCGNFWAAASGTTPFVQCYKYVEELHLITTVFSNPGTLPTTTANCLAWHPTGNHLFVGGGPTPGIGCYPVTNSAFGTILTNPVTLPLTTAVTAAAFAPQGDYVACANNTTPFLYVYPFTANPTGSIGTIVTPLAGGNIPASGPPTTVLGKALAWRPQGDYIAMGMNTTPFLFVVPFNRSTGTYGTPLTITALAAAGNAVQWTPDGQYLLVACTSSPYLYVYDFSSGTIGTAITFDGSNPGQAVNDICIHPSGNWALLTLNASTYLTGITLPNKARNYIRLND